MQFACNFSTRFFSFSLLLLSLLVSAIFVLIITEKKIVSRFNW